MKAQGNYLLTTLVKEKKDEKFIAETNPRYVMCKIEAVSDIIPDVKEGDVYFYDKSRAYDLTIDGKVYQVIKVEDLVVKM